MKEILQMNHACLELSDYIHRRCSPYTQPSGDILDKAYETLA